jgi:hypothetical protein
MKTAYLSLALPAARNQSLNEHHPGFALYCSSRRRDDVLEDPLLPNTEEERRGQTKTKRVQYRRSCSSAILSSKLTAARVTARNLRAGERKVVLVGYGEAQRSVAASLSPVFLRCPQRHCPAPSASAPVSFPALPGLDAPAGPGPCAVSRAGRAVAWTPKLNGAGTIAQRGASVPVAGGCARPEAWPESDGA